MRPLVTLYGNRCLIFVLASMRCDLANAWQTLGKPEARIVKMLANIVSYVKNAYVFLHIDWQGTSAGGSYYNIRIVEVTVFAVGLSTFAEKLLLAPPF